jgi:hypothetical protein
VLKPWLTSEISAYNYVDQVTSVTLPDPDGGGGQSAPVPAYAYDLYNRI